MAPEKVAYLERLEALIKKMRRAYWHARKFKSKLSADEAHQTGLNIDQLIREENARLERLSKELK
ncbi:MAG TPA: hypothetical protein DCL43_16660 [Chitinophagaceae bacterium]|nr:hypothetical protein [Chitinophagaceae bacterium]HAN37652.1 hypothetical protein [Chitinophagaceae bacterium]